MRSGLLRVLALVVLLGACSRIRSCGSEPIAELISMRGHVERDHEQSPESWEHAAVGASFHVGDGLRTRTSSQALVNLSDGGELRLDSDTLVRFLSTAPGSGERGIDVLTGNAEIEAGEEALKLRTRIGLAVLESGSRVRLSRSDGGFRYEVSVGAARLEPSVGPAKQLRAGQSIDIEIGGALVERTAARDASRDAGTAQAIDARAADGQGDATPGAFAAKIQRRPVRVQVPGSRSWESITPGDTTLAAGSTLRVPARATVDVSRDGENATLIGAGEYVLGQPGEALARAVDGRVTMQAEQQEIRIEVPGGVIVARAGIQGGSLADVQVRGNRGTAVHVRAGVVEVRGRSATDVLRIGESRTLSRDGSFDPTTRAPERADFSVTAGESFTVRDPSPPTALGFRFGQLCPGGGVAELLEAGRRPIAVTHGTDRANLLVPRGNFRYQVRCSQGEGLAEQAAAQGTIRVLRDAGLARPPPSPPTNLVDTDGRRYTLLYQNLLPRITVRWPNPPSADGYELRVAGSGGAPDVIRVARPTHTFAPGQLAEGTYRLMFQVGGSPDRQSRETTLQIGFDNAAPTASVREPADRSFTAGSAVHVSGIALEGWTVSVDGRPLPLDSQHRFSSDVTAPANESAIAIRLHQPGRGVNYYVRRAKGGP